METTEAKTDKTTTQSGSSPITNINVTRIIQGLMEFGNLEIEDFNTNIGISKTVANLTVVEKAYSKTMQTLMKKHIKTDDNGNLMSANGFYIFKSEKDKNEYQDTVEKLNDTVVNEKVHIFKTSFLKDIKGLKGATMVKFHELIVDDRKEEKK